MLQWFFLYPHYRLISKVGHRDVLTVSQDLSFILRQWNEGYAVYEFPPGRQDNQKNTWSSLRCLVSASSRGVGPILVVVWISHFFLSASVGCPTLAQAWAPPTNKHKGNAGVWLLFLLWHNYFPYIPHFGWGFCPRFTEQTSAAPERGLISK